MSKVTSSLMIFAASLAIVASAANAFGSDEKWSSGFGQGVCEAIVTSGAGNEIYVGCDCGSDRPSSISFQLAGKSPTGDLVFLSFDGGQAEDVSLWNSAIPSDCRACASNFDYVKERLKRHSNVRVMFQNGDAANFTLKGSTAAIGECEADFWK
jgi:hypothetical protein